MKFFVFLAGLALSCSALAQETGDAAFMAAREAYRNGDLPKVEKALANLGPHVLVSHAENYRQRILLARNDPGGVPAFLARHEGSYVAEKLRADWIRWLAKQGDWAAVQREFPKLAAPEPELTCLSRLARGQLGDRKAYDEARTTWLELIEPPEGCKQLFETLVREGVMQEDDLWARARRQMEANRPGAARQTLAGLPRDQQPDDKAWEAMQKQAMGFLARQGEGGWGRRSQREITLFAVQRVATQDPAMAAQELQKRLNVLQTGERQWAWSQIALQAARKHQPEAVSWYEQAEATPLSEDNHQWRVRAALRAQSWNSVRRAIEAMPSDLAARPEWVYWLGRAYRAGGRTAEAQALFEKIAGQAHFYGNLADEELGRLVQTPPRARPTTPEEQRAARDNPSLRRALALIRLDVRTEGIREWNWGLRGMSDRELIAAAELAHQHQIWDRAINTADRTRQEHDYTLRFLAPYADQIRPVAQAQSVDDAWVYGLMRQESRFISNAKSTVGASGLMQLMPATAKWVAKKIGLRDYHPGRVNDTEVNVLLGTSYMRLVMENLDNHPVLASAAYNAGPSRAIRWRADRPLEGAIYAETIPFTETRDYVKKVMSNAVYYSALFNGKPDSLKQRLGTVGPRNGGPSRDQDLP